MCQHVNDESCESRAMSDDHKSEVLILSHITYIGFLGHVKLRPSTKKVYFHFKI